jgi:hypothetical protein
MHTIQDESAQRVVCDTTLVAMRTTGSGVQVAYVGLTSCLQTGALRLRLSTATTSCTALLNISINTETYPNSTNSTSVFAQLSGNLDEAVETGEINAVLGVLSVVYGANELVNATCQSIETDAFVIIQPVQPIQPPTSSPTHQSPEKSSSLFESVLAGDASTVLYGVVGVMSCILLFAMVMMVRFYLYGGGEGREGGGGGGLSYDNKHKMPSAATSRHGNDKRSAGVDAGEVTLEMSGKASLYATYDDRSGECTQSSLH